MKMSDLDQQVNEELKKTLVLSKELVTNLKQLNHLLDKDSELFQNFEKMNESMNVWNQMFKNYKENKTEE